MCLDEEEYSLDNYLNTRIEEFVIAALHPDHALVQVWGIQDIFGLESQVIPE